MYQSISGRVVERHFLSLLQDALPLPSLVVVDGGRGQLGAAARALAALDLAARVHLIGLAKRHEEIFVAGREAPVLLPRTSPALKLLQRLRDEAHRFAITYHRRLRDQELVRSALDDIPGVGANTRVALLRHFGSVDALRAARAEDLCAVPGVGPVTAERPPAEGVDAEPAERRDFTSTERRDFTSTERRDLIKPAISGIPDNLWYNAIR